MNFWRGAWRGLLVSLLLWALIAWACSSAHAAVSTFAGSFLADNANAATTTQDVSGLGFNPKLCVFWYVGRAESTDTVDGTFARGFVGYGFATDTEDVCTYAREVDNAAANFWDGGWRQDSIVIEIDDADTATLTGRLQVNDMDTPANDGFQVIYDDQFVNDIRVFFWCVGGTDVTNVDIGTDTAPTTATSKSVTGLGFQPEVLLLLQCSHTTAAPHGPTGDRSCNLGAATGASNEGIVATNCDAGSTSADCGTYGFNNESAAVLSTTVPQTTATSRAEFTQFTSGGFDLNYLEVLTTGERFFYAVVRGGTWRVDNFTTSTTLDADIVESGFGFQPRGALMWSGSRALSTQDTPTAAMDLTIGAFHSTTARVATGIQIEAGTANMEIATAVDFDSCYVNLSTADAIEGVVDVQSIDSDGFTMNQDDGDPAASFVLYVAVGDEPAAPSFTPRRLPLVLD